MRRMAAAFGEWYLFILIDQPAEGANSISRMTFIFIVDRHRQDPSLARQGKIISHAAPGVFSSLDVTLLLLLVLLRRKSGGGLYFKEERLSDPAPPLDLLPSPPSGGDGKRKKQQS